MSAVQNGVANPWGGDHGDGVVSVPGVRVWSYTVGMGRLLLRSPKSPGAATRVDVLFQNVKALKLPTRLEGLSLRSPGDEELQSIGDSPAVGHRRGARRRLQGQGYTGNQGRS